MNALIIMDKFQAIANVVHNFPYCQAPQILVLGKLWIPECREAQYRLEIP